jgi:hypothetical protein
MYLYLLYDTVCKSIISIYNDEKIVKTMINDLVRKDIDDEILLLRHKILDEVSTEKRQLLSMTIENLEVQKNISDMKNCYVKNGEVVQRYIFYSKIMNSSKHPIFFYP